MMFDAASRSETASLQPRARGSIAIAVKHDGTRSRLDRLRHQGSAKCLLPRGSEVPEGVIVNTAGGVTGGDRFAWSAETGTEAALTLTTQAAERVYRAQPGEIGQMTTRLTLGARSTLAWLPQETILYDRGALDRRLAVEMAADATLLLLEPLILGRQAMGETVTQAHFTDAWTVHRGGTLIFADTLRLSGPVAEIAARPAVLNGARATASLLLAAPFAEDRLAPARAALESAMTADPGVEGGASAWDGMLAARLVATDGLALRRAVLSLVNTLAVAPVPRVWAT
ncbi:MAG: urease accessory protein UreD [Pseudomonadota bacterium]